MNAGDLDPNLYLPLYLNRKEIWKALVQLLRSNLSTLGGIAGLRRRVQREKALPGIIAVPDQPGTCNPDRMPRLKHDYYFPGPYIF